MHKSSFKLEHKRTFTTLKYHVLNLKNKNIDFNIKWEVAKKVKLFAPGDKVCKLCLQEKLSNLLCIKKRRNFWTLRAQETIPVKP